MPIVTQSRGDPYVPLIADFRVEGSPRDTGDIGFYPGSQTTTSYRSLKRSADPDAEFNDLSGPEMARQLQSNYRTRYDNGHEFTTEKRWVTFSHQRVSLHAFSNLAGSGPYHQSYEGAVYPHVNNTDDRYPTADWPSEGQIEEDGTSLIRRTVPTAPEAGLWQALAEFAQQVPNVVGIEFMKGGGFGDTLAKEHLNLEFGINSTIRDIIDLAQSVKRFNKIAKQYLRDAGPNKHVRRKALLFDKTSIFERNPSFVSGIRMSPTYYGDIRHNFIDMSSARLSVIDDYRFTARFSGAYTYAVTQATSLETNIAHYDELANKLIGARLTPETVWALTPWSWLLGWFFSAGDLMANITAFSSDNLVLRYGYVMHETHATRTIIYQDLKPVNGWCPEAVYLTGNVIRKTRRAASPYGFGWNPVDFTPRKLAILMALGLTKSPGVARTG